MKKKPRVTPFFRRTLVVVLVFWLVLMCVLTVNNYDRTKNTMQNAQSESQRDLRYQVKLVMEGTATPEEKPGILGHWISGGSYYRHHSLGVARLYDENGTELARSQLSRGSVAPEGTGVHSIYLRFDAVFSEEEHLALAYRLREGGHERTSFNGFDTGEYGEVTGILKENILYPQKMVFYFKDGPFTLMESDHPMFKGAELTTIRFDASYVSSALVDTEMEPERLLELYRQAEALLDELLEDWGPSTSSGGTLVGKDSYARVANYYDLEGYPIAYAYAYIPWRMAVSGLEVVYVLTFLAALLAAWYINRAQSKFMEKERELTRAMAHEFKTPAAVIRAYAEALREDVAPQRREEYLTTLMEEADRMGSMVNELLDLSRLNGASPPLEWEEVDLKALVEDCFERLRLPMEERGLTLDMALWPCTCVADKKRLERAVSNLALNVLHHAQPGPVKVRLMAHRVLTVENRCAPIPPQELERLWEPFYKGDASRSGEGSGLGLAIVENIIQLYGGTAAAEATSNGVRFRIALPN